MAKAKLKQKAAAPLKRPFTTDYGLTKGHCATLKGAIKSAVCYLIDNDGARCTIEGAAGWLARVENHNMWITVRPNKGQVARSPLRRIK